MIFVDGATGYIGNHLVHALRIGGYQVRCLVREEAREDDIAFLKSLGAQIHCGSLETNSSEVGEAFNAVSCAVHLIGSIAPKRGEKLSDLHGKQTANFVQNCQKQGVSKVILVTALGTSPTASSMYHLTKWQAEETLIKSGLPHVILRPSLLVGRTVGLRDSKLVRRLRELILTKKAVPLINGGKNHIQPLFISDLVMAITKIIASNGAFENQIFELGGPETISMRQFVMKLMKILQVTKPIVNLNPFFALALAYGFECWQEVPIISRDQVKLSLTDNICQTNTLASVFGIKQTSLETALESYKIV